MDFQEQSAAAAAYTFCSFIPPYVLDHMAESSDSRVRRLAIEAIANASAIRAVRATLSTMPTWAATPSPTFRRHRLVYDVKNGGFDELPGRLVRGERDAKSEDAPVNEAFSYSGSTYNFYRTLFNRNS